jgi:hypothetical protein
MIRMPREGRVGSHLYLPFFVPLPSLPFSGDGAAPVYKTDGWRPAAVKTNIHHIIASIGNIFSSLLFPQDSDPVNSFPRHLTIPSLHRTNRQNVRSASRLHRAGHERR